MSNDDKITNCIRALAIDTVQKAESGHPGAPMGMAPVANVLFSEFLKFDPTDSQWFDRDRFVLSNGHASALIYTMLHLCGYKLSMDDLKQFRQLNSITPGHPERGVTEGVEVTTGPLGQGISNAVGLAIAEAQLAATFNKQDAKVVDHFTYVFCGDGCLMEGVACEALSLAGHLALRKLIIIYDDNNITIDGNTSIAFTEDTAAKYTALGFNTIRVGDGNKDYSSIREAIAAAQKSDKPTMILLKTVIGIGSKMQNTAKVHGSPLGEEDIKAVKSAAGRDPNQKFFVEPEVYEHFKKAASRGQEAHKAWNDVMTQYKQKYPQDYEVLMQRLNNVLPNDLKDKLPRNGDKSIATRKASENALAVIYSMVPQILGGSADLTGSNLTRPGEAALVDFQKDTPAGRYIRFGVREHGMCAILNGLHAHGGIIPFGGTFLNFISYAWGSVRLAAMSHHQVIYVGTHDSIGVGEDGPTHQPTELVAALRATPNLHLMRPSDQTETSACWALALESKTTPSCLCLTRQGTMQVPSSSFEGVYKGGYAVVEEKDPQVIIIGTGSEVGLAIKAAKELSDLRVRVVSLPIWSVFDAQPEEYKNSVLTEGVPTLSVEAYHPLGWERYSHFHIGLESWGASAPADKLFDRFGLTPSNVAAHARKLVEHFGSTKAPAKRALKWPMNKL